MLPVTELEMAANTTFSSILNEIQLSNLNFTIQMTPYAAYITLKKTVQKDMNGTLATPAPPLLFLLRQAQEQAFRLQNENSQLRSATENLEIKYDGTRKENVRLIEAVEEMKKAVADLNVTKSILLSKIDKLEADSARNRAEKIESEVKLKENKKQHVSDLKESQAQVKDLKNAIKTKEKENYDLNRTLDNARSTIKSYKTERSELKICKTRLESEIKKLKQKQLKEKKEPFDKTINSENKDENDNLNVSPAISNESELIPPILLYRSTSSPPCTSMISHWNPSPVAPPLTPNSTTTMVSHCTRSPSPNSLLWSAQEYKEMIERIIERAFANFKWDPLDAQKK